MGAITAREWAQTKKSIRWLRAQLTEMEACRDRLQADIDALTLVLQMAEEKAKPKQETE